MENSEFKANKRQLSDIKRLESLKQRQQEKNSQLKQISASLKNLDTSISSGKRIKFNFNDEAKTDEPAVIEVPKNLSNSEAKSNLFESDSEDDVDDGGRFNIKPQFEGERGKELFERNMGITDARFKLDERFNENEDLSDENSAPSGQDENSAENEKDKNLAILEEVLGFQIPKRLPDAQSKRKRKYVSYDPESENASELVQKPKAKEKTVPAEKKRKMVIEPLPEPVVSKERFFEVTSDLNQILGSSSSPFSFSQQFNIPEENRNKQFDADTPVDEDDSPKVHQSKLSTPKKNDDEIKKKPAVEGNLKFKKKFFISADDERLKEGIEFFRRTKPINEIREEWSKTREDVVEMFKRNRRLALKSSKVSTQSFQRQMFQKRQFSRR